MLAIVLAGAGFKLYQLYGPGSRTGTFQATRISKITSNGRAGLHAAISPDGRRIACVTTESGRQSMRLRHVPSGSDVQLIAPSEVKFDGVTFAPDGNSICYAARDATSASALYQMPVLGGRSKKLLSQIDGPVAFSPDGRQIAFVRRSKSLVMARSDGQEDRELAACGTDEIWRYPAWSPDGSIIACSIGNSKAAGDYLVAVNARDAKRKTFPSPEWTRIYWMAWLPDGSGLVLNALDNASRSSQLWILGYPVGQLRRITNDLNSHYGVSLTADAKSLVCVQGERVSNIWLAHSTGSARRIRITSGVGKDEGITGIAWTPDNRIVFVSKASGHCDLWIMSQNGSDQRQLTENAHNNYYPAVSPDCRSIAFVSDRAGKNDLWKMDIDRTGPRPLTNSGGVNRPLWSKDGRWIVYEARDGPGVILRKVSSEGGDSMPVTRVNARMPALSPDGKLVAFYADYDHPGTSGRIAAVPLQGGPSVVLLESLPSVTLAPFRWSADGGYLTFNDNRGGSFDIWNMPIKGGPARKMTDLRMPWIFDFDWSSDGKRFACAASLRTFMNNAG